MTLTHQATNVSGVTAVATSVPIAYPGSIAAGDLLLMEIGSKGPGTATSGSSIGPLTVPAGWFLLGTRTNGTTAPGADTGSVRGYLLLRIADGSETGSINVALAAADSSAVTIHRFTRDTTKELSWQVTFGADATSGTAWSVAFGENPGLKVGDVLITAGVIPTDAVTSRSAPGLTATGLTASQTAQRTTLNVTTGNDLGLFVNEWSVTAGPASSTPTWTNTLAGTTTNAVGIGMLLRLREVTPNPSGPQLIAKYALDSPDATGAFSSPAISLQAGDIVVAIGGTESVATITLTEDGSQSAIVQESRVTGSVASGRMWTYEATGSESVTFTFNDATTAHSRVYLWHVRGGTLTGMTKVSVQDTAASAPFVTLPSVPSNALIIGGLVDFSATSNTGSHLAWPVADDIIVDADDWASGEARWVAWHTWSSNTQQGPTLPTSMIATTFAIAIPPGTAASSVTLTPVTGTFSAPSVGATSGPTSVTLTPITGSLTATPIVATPGVTLTPITGSFSAVPVSATVPSNVTLTPITGSFSAVPVTATPAPISVTLTPVTGALTARPVVATPSVTLTPITGSFSAVPVSAVPNVNLSPVAGLFSAPVLGTSLSPVLRTLTPIVGSFSAPPVSAVPGPTSVTLTAVSGSLTARPVTPAPGPTSVTLTPVTGSFSAPSLAPGNASFVTLTPVTGTFTARPLGILPTLVLAPVVGTLSARPVTLTPGVNLAPVVGSFTARAVVLTPVVSLAPVVGTFAAVPVSAVPVASVTLTPVVGSFEAVPLVARKLVAGDGRARHEPTATGRTGRTAARTRARAQLAGTSTASHRAP